MSAILTVSLLQVPRARDHKIFCLSCQSCVCYACIVTDHQTHKVILLEKAADNEKGNIMAEASATRENEKALMDLIRKFEETMLRGIEIPKNQCTLEELDQPLQAGVPAELILCLRTPEGEIINHPDLKNQLEVIIEPTKDVTNVIISEKENGKFKMNFTPKVPGAYKIEVKINGDKLANCPFTAQVNERELVVVGAFNLKLFQGDELRNPYGIAVNTTGKIAITDWTGHCVYILDNEGNCLRKIGSKGVNAGQFLKPWGVTYLNDNEILIADARNSRIQQVDVEKELL